MKKKSASKTVTSDKMADKTKPRRVSSARGADPARGGARENDSKKKAPLKRAAPKPAATKSAATRAAAAKPSRAEVAVPAGTSSRAERNRRDSREAAEAAIDAALDKKALLPVLLDVSDQASYTDFIGIVSGRSDRQVDAIAENVARAMSERGRRLIGREGNGNGRWTLLDFGDVVLHVFYHPVRELYDIESLWSDAPRVKLTVPPEAQLYQPDALYNTL